MAKSSIFNFIQSIIKDSRVKQMFFCSPELEGYYTQVLHTLDLVTDCQYRRVSFDYEIQEANGFDRGTDGFYHLNFAPFQTVAGSFYDGRVDNPYAVAQRPSNGDFWVANRYRRISIFDSDWNYKDEVGRWGNATGEFIIYPYYIEFYVDDLGREWLWVVMGDYHSVKAFIIPDGTDRMEYQFELGTYGHAGVDANHLYSPRQIAFDKANKKMYIVNNRGRYSGAPRDGWIARYDISGLDNDPPSPPVFEDVVLWGKLSSCTPQDNVVCTPVGVRVYDNILIVSYAGWISAFEIGTSSPYEFRYIFQPQKAPYTRIPSPRYLSLQEFPGRGIYVGVTDVTFGNIAIYNVSGAIVGYVGQKEWEAYMGNPNSPLRFQEPMMAYLFEREGDIYIAAVDYGNERIQVGSLTDLSNSYYIVTEPITFEEKVEIKDIIIQTNIPLDYLKIWYKYDDVSDWFLLDRKMLRTIQVTSIQIKVEVGPFINSDTLPPNNSYIESIGVAYEFV